MQYLLTVVLWIETFIFKRSKFFYLLLLLLMWVFLGWSLGNADYLNYQASYTRISNISGFEDTTEIGYQILVKLASYFGISYNVFLIIISIICLFLISNTIIKYSKNYSGVLSLYFLYPFIIDTTQVRFFIAMSLFIFSIRFLIEKSKRNFLFYLIFILLATTIHYSAFFYTLFALTYFFSNNQLTIITIIGLFLMVSLGPNLLNIVNLIVPIERIDRYFMFFNSIDKLTFIAMLGYFIINIFLIHYAKKRYSSLLGDNNSTLTGEYFNEVVLGMNILLFFIIPFLVTSLEFIRVQRGVFILNYISFLSITNQKNMSAKDFIFIVLVLSYVLISLWFFVYRDFSETVFFPMFEQNIIFE